MVFGSRWYAGSAPNSGHSCMVISSAGVDLVLGIYIVRSLPGHVVIASAALRLQKWQSGVGPGEKNGIR